MLVARVAAPIQTPNGAMAIFRRFSSMGGNAMGAKTVFSRAPKPLSSHSSNFVSKTQKKLFSSSSPRLSQALSEAAQRKRDNISSIMYVTSAGIVMVGVSYASVPLYKVFCQATGAGGTVITGHNTEQVSYMRRVEDTVLDIHFNADTHSSMMWNFKPQQPNVTVRPGETALAFYKAKNPLDVPVIGISTYNVVPFEVAPYFNKIQCFCFEEQRLNPGEEVDLPVFFYIDPEFCEDPALEEVTDITLSYTFFEAKDGFQIPLPGYINN